ncbi:MAG: hypothetical protein ABEJ31_09220 [Haloarculaceae archaeon]
MDAQQDAGTDGTDGGHGLFARVREFLLAAGHRRPYVCRSCGARFECQRQVCPLCGGYDIEAVRWLAGD